MQIKLDITEITSIHCIDIMVSLSYILKHKGAYHESFFGALRDSGADVMLDTRVDELSDEHRFRGKVDKTPWASKSRPLSAQDSELGSKSPVLGEIADFAVRLGVSAVLSPSHFLDQCDLQYD